MKNIDFQYTLNSGNAWRCHRYKKGCHASMVVQKMEKTFAMGYFTKREHTCLVDESGPKVRIIFIMLDTHFNFQPQKKQAPFAMREQSKENIASQSSEGGESNDEEAVQGNEPFDVGRNLRKQLNFDDTSEMEEEKVCNSIINRYIIKRYYQDKNVGKYIMKEHIKKQQSAPKAIIYWDIFENLI